MATALIKNARILDTSKEDASDPSDIYVETGQIREITRAGGVSVSSDVVIDAGGRFALPGLIDCHAHPFLADTNLARLNEVPLTLMTARAGNILRNMLMRGFTTIRDAAGGDWGIKQAVEEDEVIGPRMFIAGRALSQTGGHGDSRRKTEDSHPCRCADALAITGVIADGLDEVRKAVREELRLGADQIKIFVSGGVSSPHDPLECDQYSPEEIRVIVEEATRRNTYVMAHAYGASAIKIALEQGVRTIEHGNLIDEEAAALAAQKGAYVVPTLVTYTVLEEEGRKHGWSSAMLDKLAVVKEAGLASVDICKKAGVKLGLGTDLLGDSFDHQSREFLIRAEIETPREVLHSATRINAEILNRTGQLGEISAGAIADILLLERNPFDDLGVLQDQGAHMPLIMKRGQVYKNTLQ
ncbi:amidohydrolase family protein [Marinicaulis aureus]|uniref:Amidohydrolase family protein n=1 Tax=Hyphococcus aureus TaxID=2666033 RepID=A0ABW1KZZ1_9PROT